MWASDSSTNGLIGVSASASIPLVMGPRMVGKGRWGRIRVTLKVPERRGETSKARHMRHSCRIPPKWVGQA